MAEMQGSMSISISQCLKEAAGTLEGAAAAGWPLTRFRLQGCLECMRGGSGAASGGA